MSDHDIFDRVRRLFGEVAFDHLRQKTVVIIGLGSGGGIVALELAKLGVGKFILIDPDHLEESNVVRHVCDLRDVGKLKVQAVGELILHRNPAATVTTLPVKVEDALDALAQADVVAVCVDSEPAKQAINLHLRELGLPAVYAGVYERGEGGDVFVCYWDHGPCYACMASQMVLDDAAPAERPMDYGQIEDGVLKGEPGLGIDVGRIALMQAKLCLRVLLREVKTSFQSLPGNLVILANEPGMILGEDENGPVVLGMGGAFWLNLSQLEDCRVCRLAKISDGRETSLEDIFAN